MAMSEIMHERKKRVQMEKRQTGFLQYLVFRRVCIEGTMRIKALEETDVVAIRDAFILKYPEAEALCNNAKVKRVFDSFRPFQASSTRQGTEPTLPTLQHTATMHRYVAFDAMQREAKRLLDTLELEEPSNTPLDSEGNDLKTLHSSFVAWCGGYGADIESAAITRVALQRAMEKNRPPNPSSNVKFSSSSFDEPEEQRECSVKYMSKRICNKQKSFERKVFDLLQLHNEKATSRKAASKTAFLAPLEAQQVPSVADMDQSLEALQNDIQAMENALIDAYEKRRKLSPSKAIGRRENRKAVFLGYFILPSGKVRQYSAGIGIREGDYQACRLLLAKHDCQPDLSKKKWLSYTAINK